MQLTESPKLALLGFLLVSPTQAQISFGPSQALTDCLSSPTNTLAWDTDDDGDLDILASDIYGPKVVWWENDGNGNFARGQEWLWQDEDPLATVVGIRDANGDGLPDIYLSGRNKDSKTYYVKLALATGSGSFGAASVIPGFESKPEFETPLQDLNKDGHFDFYGENWFQLSHADGGYAPVINSPRISRETKFADLDGDGDWDILNGTSASLVDADGNMSDPITLADLPDTQIQTIGILPAKQAGDPALVVVIHSKFDQQFIPNIKIDETASIFRLNASSTAGEHLDSIRIFDETLEFLSPKIWEASESGSAILTRIKTTLEDRARRFGSKSQTLVQKLAWADGSLEIKTVLESDRLIVLNPPVLADLDGDKNQDLVLPSAQQLVWHPGTGEETFASSPTAINIPSEGQFLFSFEDIDDDGVEEILIGNLTPNISDAQQQPGFYDSFDLWKQDASDGLWKVRRLNPPHDHLWVRSISTLDVSGQLSIAGVDSSIVWPEGRKEFLVTTYDQNTCQTGYQILLQSSSGNFIWGDILTPEAIRIPKLASSRFHFIDWNADGNKDLIIFVIEGDLFRSGNSKIYFQEGGTLNGAPVFGRPKLIGNIEPSGDRNLPTLMDVDHDGDPDLITRGKIFGGTAPSTYWFENEGNTTLSTIHKLPGVGAPAGIDIDQDGFQDFLLPQTPFPYFAYRPQPGDDPDQIGYALSKPGGKFEASPQHFGAGFSHVDLDSDGDLDALFLGIEQQTTELYNLSWLEQTEKLLFETDSDLKQEGVFFPTNPLAPAILANRKVAHMVDIDKDGIKDLLIYSSLGSGASGVRLEWFKITTEAQPAAFTAWARSAGMTGHSSAPSGDWDKDQRTNWEEFSFGSDPMTADVNNEFFPRITSTDLGQIYTFQFRTEGVTRQDLTSIDLQTWIPLKNPEVTPSVKEGYQQISYPVPSKTKAGFFKTTSSPSVAE